jgi:5S rRNA maturation endonuclease (ribonuclease M5)
MTLDELLRELNVDFKEPGQHHHARGPYINIDCPFCSPSSGRYRLGIHIYHLYSTCWSCGRHDTLSALERSCDRPRRDIAALLYSISGGIPRERETTPGKLKVPIGVGPLLSQHKKYLTERGFNWKELVKLWDIRGIGLAPDLPWRVFIPVFHKGQMVSWTTRSIADDHSQRYIAAGAQQESYSHKKLLYGVDYCRSTAILCEGPLDVWAAGPGAICTFGIAYGRSQIEQISRYPRRIICFDNDRDGQRRAQALCESLSCFDGETVNVRLSAKDPAEALTVCPEELTELRKRFLE